MKILFVREGFAHNSSSNHGVIKKVDVSNILFSTPDDYNYHWDNFLIKNKKDKSKYILTQVVSFIKSRYIQFSYFNATDSYINRLIKDLIKNSKVSDFLKFPSINTDFSIDHQSCWNFPLAYNNHYSYNEEQLNNFIDVDFLYDLTKYLLSEDIYIVGGNDNEESKLENVENVVYLVQFLKKYGDIYSRKDDTGNWVLSNENIGDILVVNFENEVNNDNIKLSIPYLIDLNITDQCSNGCEFCYRSCNVHGSYASCRKISNILECLHYSGVSEFVIGGGDITLHPEIKNLFSVFSKYKTACTLHYKSFIKIVENGNIIKYINSFKSIAISLTDASDNEIIKISDIIRNLTCGNWLQFNLQFIAELTSIDRLNFIFENCKYIPINILGYKDCGRGISFRNDNNLIEIDNNYINMLINSKNNVSCDAIFANKYKKILLSENASELHLAKQDGYCSCFYDTVNSYIQPSSYSNEKFNFNIEDFQDRYGWVNNNEKNNFKEKFKTIFSKF